MSTWKPGDKIPGGNGLVRLMNGKNRRANVKITKSERDVYDRCHEAMYAGSIYSWQIDHRLGCWLVKIAEHDDWREMTMGEVAELLPASPLATIHPISKLNPKESTMKVTKTTQSATTVDEALAEYLLGGKDRLAVVARAQEEAKAAKAARKAGKPVPATPALDAVQHAHAQGIKPASSKAKTPGVRTGRPTIDDAGLTAIIVEQVNAGARTRGAIDRHLRSQGIASNTKRIKFAWAACIADGMTVASSAPVVVEMPQPIVKRAAKPKTTKSTTAKSTTAKPKISTRKIAVAS